MWGKRPRGNFHTLENWTRDLIFAVSAKVRALHRFALWMPPRAAHRCE